MQNKKFRQLLAAVLSVVMVLSLFVVPAAAEGTADPGTYTFDATGLADVQQDYGGKDKYGDKEPIEALTSLFSGYFTTTGEVLKRAAKPQSDDSNGNPKVTDETQLDFSTKSVELGKNGGGSIDFTVTGTATVTVNAASTSGSNTSDVALMKGDAAVTEKDSKATVTGTTGVDFVYENLTAGTYSVKSAGGSNTGRGTRIYTITVVQTAAAEEPTTEPSASESTEPSASESTQPSASTEPSASESTEPTASTEPSASTQPSAEPSTEPSAEPLDWPKSAPTSGTFVLDAGEVFAATADKADFRSAEAQSSNANRYSMVMDAAMTWDNDFFAIFSKTQASVGAPTGGSAAYFEADARNFEAGTDDLGEDYAAYSATHNISFGDKAKFIAITDTYEASDGSLKYHVTAGDAANAVIGFKTGAPAVVRVWWRGGGTGGRTVAIVVPDNTATTEHADDKTLGVKSLLKGTPCDDANVLHVDAFELEEAGTYYLGNVVNSNRIYKVEVVVGDGTTVEPSESPAPSTEPSTTPSTQPSTEPSAEPSTTPSQTPTTAAGKALAEAIKAANTAKGNVKVSTDGSDVAKSRKWVTQAVMTAYEDAIAAAQAVLDNAEATDEQLTNAKGTLATATATFEAAQENGTKKNNTASGAVTTTPGTPATPVGTVNTVNPDGTAVTTTKDKDGNVDITVKAEDGAVLAEIKLPATVAAPATGFVDVPAGHWAEAAINEMAGLGMVNGVNDEGTVFDMTSPINRASIAAMLHRLAGNQAGTEVDFADVAADAWYAADVAWAVKAGVVTGYDATTFGPNDTITRQQLAVMLARLARLAGVDTDAHASALEAFVDGANTADWATAGTAWCVKVGILKGKGADTLDPTAAVSRAEAAVMVDRLLALLK